MEIVVGTYEHYLLGYKLITGKEGYELQQIFASQAHTGPVSCLAVSNKYLVSGSVDETIQIFNMKTKKEIGNLIHHDGTVTCLNFFDDTHLFSSSEDKTICVWSSSNWKCLKTLQGHKDKIFHISIHPSGKLILSVSKDKTLRTWNLIKGRSTYVTNIKSVAELVKWSPNGKYFVVVIGSRFDIYSIKSAGVIYSYDLKKKISCLTFLTEYILFFGGDCENLQVCDIKNKTTKDFFKIHDNRIKDLCCVQPINMKNNTKWLISCSSDGYVKIWEISLDEISVSPKFIAGVNTTCRPTCLTVWNLRSTYDDSLLSFKNTEASELNTSEPESSGEPTKKKKKSKLKSE